MEDMFDAQCFQRF